MAQFSADATASLNDSELAALDHRARENYEIKLFLVKEKVMHKPSLDTFYYNQASATMASIPADLQLPVLLSRYNDVCVRRLRSL
jgi:hypothetical protein